MTNETEFPPVLKDLEKTDEMMPLAPSAEWAEIIDRILDELSEEELPDDVLKAAEYLISGWPLYKIAQRLNRKTDTIRGWLTRYPRMAVAVNYGRRALHRWRMAQLEQQFLSAAEQSQRILDIGTPHSRVGSLEGLDSKILGIQGQQARFIISLFVGQKADVQVQGPGDATPSMKAQKEAMDYIADRVAKNLQDVEGVPEKTTATYRVVDGKSNKRGPLLDEEGNPMHGELRTFDTNDEGTLCHVCGNRYKHLYMHVTKGHKMPPRDYEITFLLDRGSLKDHG